MGMSARLSAAWLRLASGVAVRVGLACATAGSAIYGIFLLDGGTGVPAWLVPVSAAIGALGTGALLLVSRSAILQAAAGRVVLALACMLVLPGVASALMVVRGLGRSRRRMSPRPPQCHELRHSDCGCSVQAVDRTAHRGLQHADRPGDGLLHPGRPVHPGDRRGGPSDRGLSGRRARSVAGRSEAPHSR